MTSATTDAMAGAMAGAMTGATTGAMAETAAGAITVATFQSAALRLLAAVLAGSLVGLNRQLHHKPAGLRTHALVALAAATVTVTGSEVLGPHGNIAPIFQGVVTGMGFLGAGVIMRSERLAQVQGLTTAASIWMVACLGAALGMARWHIAFLALVLALAVLGLGGFVERFVLKRWPAAVEPPPE